MNFLTDNQMRFADPPLVFDNTMFGTYRSCPRKFYWFWRGVEAKARPAYFGFGTAWQETLGVWYLTEGSPAARFEAAIAKAKQIFQDEAVVPDKTNNLDNLITLFMWYTLNFPTEHWKVIPNGDQMELGFKLPLRGTPFYLAGAIDGYINWTPHGVLELENKTTGLSLGGTSSSYMRQWKLSTQVTQYYWALTQIIGERPFGVLMNCASKRISDKAIREFKTSGTIPSDLFCRDLQHRSDRELDEFETDKLVEILQIHRSWSDWWWPKTVDGRQCAGGMGFSQCPYFGLCISDFYPSEIEDPTKFENLAWRTEPWEPWKRGRFKRGDS
jgi:hypothetical protein